MKFLVVSFLAFIFLINSSFAQWTKQTSPVKADLYDVAFANLKFGYAVGATGTVLKTTNGGNTWVKVTAPDSADIISVAVVDTSLVIVTTNAAFGSANIYESANQGKSWHKTLTDLRPFYATAPSANNLYSASSKIYNSKNFGKDWQSQKPLNSTSTYTQINFSDNNNGIVAGNISGILTYSADFVRTVNGKDWYSGDAFSFPNANGFSSFSAVTADSVYMFTNFYNRFTPGDSSQLILLTGFHLQKVSQLWVFYSKILINSIQDVINDCKFFSGGVAYAVSKAGIIYNSSNNYAFKKEYNGEVALHAIYMLDKKNGFAVGDGGLILKRQAANNVVEQSSKNKNVVKIINAEQ